MQLIRLTIIIFESSNNLGRKFKKQCKARTWKSVVQHKQNMQSVYIQVENLCELLRRTSFLDGPFFVVKSKCLCWSVLVFTAATACRTGQVTKLTPHEDCNARLVRQVLFQRHRLINPFYNRMLTDQLYAGITREKINSLVCTSLTQVCGGQAL